jgi:hypothetical protein
MPDVVFKTPSDLATARLVPEHMPYGRFQAVLRLLLLQPSSFAQALQTADQRRLTTYALRRFLPGLSDALDLPPEQRQTLGNWADVVGGARREPMSVRYSDHRLEACAAIRRCLLCATYVMNKVNPKWDLDDVAALRPQLDHIRAHTITQAWGAVSSDTIDVSHALSHLEKILPIQDATGADKPDVVASSSEDSSSSSECSDADQAMTEHNLCWLAPKRGVLHVQRQADDSRPLCRDVAFAEWGLEKGEGIAAAFAVDKRWCPACVAKLPARLVATIVS